VEIIDYYDTLQNGGLVLDSTCAFCGHAATKVVETSEVSHKTLKIK